ncbi:MAG: YitT family protein [Lachnospiraceae bacterium]|nr:YitT family protein [Lachnospiraceae bacterium]
MNKEKINYKREALELFQIMVGTVCMALAVNIVFEPIGMVTGGVSGLAIVIKELSGHWKTGGIPVWLTNFVLNIPIFLAAMRLKGRGYIGKTLFANLCFTIALFFIPQTNIARKDYLLAAVVGSVLNGTGLGLVFANGYSTGGTDLLSAIIHHYLPYYPVGRILFVMDSLVILAGACLFGFYIATYAVIAVYLSARIMDAIIEGGKFAKLAYIISDQYEAIGREIMESLDRGVTALEGRGMYTGKSRKTLLCVVSKKEIAKLSKIAHEHDKNAFVIISDVREVLGEGFVENRQ